MLIFVSCLLWGMVAVAGGYLWSKKRSLAPVAQGEELPIATSEIIGRSRAMVGSPDSPWTLVEFGDYQCPFCRKLRPKIDELLQEHKGQIKLVFRHFPLAKHPAAFPAAVASAAAAEQGEFAAMHQALMTASLTDEAIAGAARKQGLDLDRWRESTRTTARQAVSEDVALAEKLSSAAPPSSPSSPPRAR
ncbi:hypothetical protein EON79_07915 [bacterium]|nr:MAG: hypothetical protein EON79_07915 [bacterium]